jgi:hypothetical protein
VGLKVEVEVDPLVVVVWAVEGTGEVLVDLVEGKYMLGCFDLAFSFVWSVYVNWGLLNIT